MQLRPRIVCLMNVAQRAQAEMRGVGGGKVGTGQPRVTGGGHVTLSSCRCDFDDTAQYRVSAMNTQGEQSAIASVVVKSRLFFYFYFLFTLFSLHMHK